jgi:hypothetical protein
MKTVIQTYILRGEDNMLQIIENYTKAHMAIIEYQESQLSKGERISSAEREALEINRNYNVASLEYSVEVLRLMYSINDKLDKLLNK